MKKYTFEIAITGRYLLAVSVNGEYAHYETYRINGYWQRKIRRILEQFRVRGEIAVPKKIAWEGLPRKDFLDAQKGAA